MTLTNKDKISYLLLNYLAMEGARNHFGVGLPPDSPKIEALYDKISEMGFPGEWDFDQKIYDYTGNAIKGSTQCERCWNALRIIRNNIFHANKAARPDTPERLQALLDWSMAFTAELLSENSKLGLKTKEIKQTLNIE